MNENQKPVTIIVNEFKASIERAIAESNLPACLIEPILCNYMLQMRSLNEEETRRDKMKYLANKSKEEGNDADNLRAE